MGRLFFLWFWLIAVSCWAEPYGLALVDELKQLDRPSLELAAAPLLKRGASVAIVLVRHGDERDVVKQLTQLGLWNQRISPTGILVYVSLEPRYSELRVGARFSDDLPPSTLEKIRQESLNPALREGRYQPALVESLTLLEGKLSHSLSLKDWIQRATYIFLGWGFLQLFGFWQWLSDVFWDSRPGQSVLWLWSLTPGARKKERIRLEKCRQQNLDDLQQRRERLATLLPHLGLLTALEGQQLEQFQAEIDQASSLDAPRMVDLLKRIDTYKDNLDKRVSSWSQAERTLETAQKSLQKLKSQLRDRKKTRHILETPAFQELQAELNQEQDLRERLLRAGAEEDERTRSQERCRQLAQRVQSLGERHFPVKKSPSPVDTSSWGEPSSSSTSSSSSYDDLPSYDPPASSDESRAGGDW
ncbi:hypothetical protein ABS71_07545 [bacterium SCN 62-11]|nr:TPM domain-containing protein [Candidatus Eremiobacteraeota bacterium]ODT72853.1 MAG: hypothetical protein ABS71_07545 [bacterium SCN 62-11]